MAEEESNEVGCVVKSTQTSGKVDLDFTNIADKLETFPKGKRIKLDLLTLDDLKFRATIYPNGKETLSNIMPVFVHISGDKIDNDRTVKIKITSGTVGLAANILGQSEYDDSDDDIDVHGVTHTFSFESTYKLNEFVGCGRGSPIPHAVVSKHKKVRFEISLFSSSSFEKAKSEELFLYQLKKMHSLSESEGDVTLVVKIRDDDSEQLYAPPAKKQKREDVEIKMSSVILRSASVVFDNMLKNGMREQNEKKIEIVAKSVDDVKALTYFMSTNGLPNKSNPRNLIHLAHYYQMDRLFAKCVKGAIQTVSVDNFATTINIFDKYQIEKEYSALVEFAKKNKELLKKVKDFDKISFAFRCAVLNAA